MNSEDFVRLRTKSCSALDFSLWLAPKLLSFDNKIKTSLYLVFLHKIGGVSAK